MEVSFDTTKKGLTINGGDGADKIVGSRYSDTIKAGVGTGDYIEGGTGNDKLYASTTANSNTTFSFKAGDGNDFVYSGKGEDTLNFENISLSNITIERIKTNKGKNTNDLKITYTDNDSVTIKDYYKVDKKKNSTNTIKHITTKEGTFDLPSKIIYGEGDVIGSIDNEWIVVKDGNNTINSDKGDDIIIAGNGENTFKFASGDGNDMIINANSDDIIEFTGTVDKLEYEKDRQ